MSTSSLAHACLLFTLAALSAVPAPVHSQQENPQEAAAQLEETLERLNALDRWFSDAQEQRSIWLVELRRADREVAQINLQVSDIETQIDSTNAELASLASKQDSLQAQRKTQAGLISEHIAAAYRLTGEDFLKQLLNQESPDEFARMIRYHRYFSESRLAVLQEYQDTLSQLAITNTELSAQKDQLSAQQERLQREQLTLADERQGRAKVIDELDLERQTKNEEYSRLERDRERLQTLLAELQRQVTELDGDAFAQARGNLPMPLSGRVRHAFGSPRADGRLRWHGIDIAATEGSPVTAIYRGRVIFADWLRGFGLLTILDHGGSYMTLYGHADVLYKNVGDSVESGEIIAGAGNSGGTRNTGIYFEVRHNGVPKDPMGWVLR